MVRVNSAKRPWGVESAYTVVRTFEKIKIKGRELKKLETELFLFLTTTSTTTTTRVFF